MTENEIKALIKKYLDGTINKEEEQLLERFDRELIKKYIPTLTDSYKSRLASKKKLAAAINGGQIGKYHRRNMVQIVASFLVLIAVGYLFFENTKEPVKTFAETSLLIKRADWGEKINLVLPDGTSVKLNSGSSLTFPESFNGSSREVELTGEAFFDVVKNSDRPFIIKTANLTTTVLGTSFNINSYDQNQTAAITVLTGKVRVASAKGHIDLLPNEQGVFDKNTSGLAKEQVNAKEVLLWKEGILKFDDATLIQVAEALGRWYGVTILFKEKSTAQCILTGTYDNEYLSAVLESIAFAKGLHYREKENDTIVFYGKCN